MAYHGYFKIIIMVINLNYYNFQAYFITYTFNAISFIANLNKWAPYRPFIVEIVISIIYLG